MKQKFGSTLGMALGAGAGAAVGGWAGAGIGAGLGGAVGGMLDGSGASDAAEAQQEAAQRWFEHVERQKSEALNLINTPSQMAAHDQALHGQEANVRRQEALVASLDPNIIEAGKQTAQLLQGHAAPVLQQLQTQRNQQRTQMLDQLRTHMGPGAETSSAGQQAMQQFDLQTANIMSSAQQSYLDKVSGMSLAGAVTLGQTLSQVHSALSSIQTQSPGAQAAQLIAQFTQAEGGAQSAMTEAAGGEFADDQIQSQKMQNLAGGLLQAGAAVYGNKSLQKPGGTPGQTTPTDGAENTNTMNAESPMGTSPDGFAMMRPSPAFGGGGGGATSKPGTLAAAIQAPAGGIPNGSYGPFAGGYRGSANPGRANLTNVGNVYLPDYRKDQFGSPSRQYDASGY